LFLAAFFWEGPDAARDPEADDLDPVGGGHGVIVSQDVPEGKPRRSHWAGNRPLKKVICQRHEDHRPIPNSRSVLSFELFPPKRDGDLEGLFRTVEELKRLSPDFVSITYGAGGSTQGLTYDIALRLKAAGSCLWCISPAWVTRKGRSAPCSLGCGRRYREPPGPPGGPSQGSSDLTPAIDGFRYASELIRFVRREGFDFCLGVAGYPRAPREPGRAVNRGI
jgi:hypothetical protein